MGILAGISFVVEHCSYELCASFLPMVVGCYAAGDLAGTAARGAKAFLEAASKLPIGTSMVRGSRFTMPVASSRARLSWEESPIGERRSQAHTYAYLLERLVSCPPMCMRQGDYLAVLSHVAGRIGPFYAQVTVCHFLLFYPSLAAPPGCELVSPCASVCGPGTTKQLIELGIPPELHSAALRLMCREWPEHVRPVWEVHKVPELQSIAECVLLTMVFLMRAEMIPCAIAPPATSA